MKLLVGLGNPGQDYARHRHNIGFMALDEIARRHRFSPWRAKFQGEVAEGTIDGEKVIALRPLTYMNNSGQSVQAAAAFHKIPLADVIVFHDELDLDPGRVKVKFGGGHAGHNGLRSIHQHLGADFERVRLGIGHPGSKERVTGWVLGNFSRDDETWLNPLLEAIAAEVGCLIAGNGVEFMTRLARASQSEAAAAKPEPVAAPVRPRETAPSETSKNAMAETLKKLLGMKKPGRKPGP